MNIFINTIFHAKIAEWNIIIYFLILLSLFIFCFFIKKIIHQVKFKEKYYIFPHLHIRNISNIAMIVAMNASLIFSISWLSSNFLGSVFQIYPGSRMLIENILVKIGGILFGPILGIFIGASTDLLTVILTSSVFNYGYWVVSILNGFSGGIIYLLINMKKDSKHIKSSITSTILLLISIYLLNYFLKNNLDEGELTLNIFSGEFKITTEILVIYLATIASTIIIALGLSVLSNFLVKTTKYQNNKLINHYSKSNILIQIFAVNFVSYILIDIISLPLFDVKVSTLPYEQFLVMRSLMTIPSLIICSIIIWSICKLHQKISPVEMDRIKNEQYVKVKHCKNNVLDPIVPKILE